MGGAFASSSGSSSPSGSFSAPKKSFSDLRMTGGEESQDPEKLSTSSTPTKDEKVEAAESKQPLQTRTSFFGTPKADKTKAILGFPHHKGWACNKESQGHWIQAQMALVSHWRKLDAKCVAKQADSQADSQYHLFKDKLRKGTSFRSRQAM